MTATAPTRTPASAPEPLTLPNPRHAKRLPPHIGKEQFARIRHAAFTLPQVVKPADFVAESSTDRKSVV